VKRSTTPFADARPCAAGRGTKPDTRVGDEPCQFGDRRAAVSLQQIAWLGPIISGWIIVSLAAAVFLPETKGKPLPV